MSRITFIGEDGAAVIPGDSLSITDDGSYSGEAADALAKYEDAIERLQSQLEGVERQIDDYKAAGSLRKNTAQQLVAQKLSIKNALNAMGVNDDQ